MKCTHKRHKRIHMVDATCRMRNLSLWYYIICRYECNALFILFGYLFAIALTLTCCDYNRWSLWRETPTLSRFPGGILVTSWLIRNTYGCDFCETWYFMKFWNIIVWTFSYIHFNAIRTFLIFGISVGARVLYGLISCIFVTISHMFSVFLLKFIIDICGVKSNRRTGIFLDCIWD